MIRDTRRERWPITFREKVDRKIREDRRPEIAIFADRLAARAFARERVPSIGVPKLLAAVTDLKGVQPADLPPAFAVKANHGSGGVVLIHPDGAPMHDRELRDSDLWSRHRTRLGPLTWTAVQEFMRRHTDIVYAGPRPERVEHAYAGARRLVVIEQYLDGGSGHPPADYKFYCFHGTCRFFHVVEQRYDSLRLTIFDRDGVALPVSLIYPRPERPPALHTRYREAIEMADAIAKGVDFARIDLYLTDAEVIFGEVTNYPHAAIDLFDPPQWERRLARWWRSPRDYSRYPDRNSLWRRAWWPGYARDALRASLLRTR